MSKLLRAVIISTVATGAAILMVNIIQQKNGKPVKPEDRFIDAEKLSEEEQAQLSNELDAML